MRGSGNIHYLMNLLSNYFNPTIFKLSSTIYAYGTYVKLTIVEQNYSRYYKTSSHPISSNFSDILKKNKKCSVLEKSGEIEIRVVRTPKLILFNISLGKYIKLQKLRGTSPVSLRMKNIYCHQLKKQSFYSNF